MFLHASLCGVHNSDHIKGFHIVKRYQQYNMFSAMPPSSMPVSRKEMRLFWAMRTLWWASSNWLTRTHPLRQWDDWQKRQTPQSLGESLTTYTVRTGEYVSLIEDKQEVRYYTTPFCMTLGYVCLVLLSTQTEQVDLVWRVSIIWDAAHQPWLYLKVGLQAVWP